MDSGYVYFYCGDGFIGLYVCQKRNKLYTLNVICCVLTIPQKGYFLKSLSASRHSVTLVLLVLEIYSEHLLEEFECLGLCRFSQVELAAKIRDAHGHNLSPPSLTREQGCPHREHSLIGNYLPWQIKSPGQVKGETREESTPSYTKKG